MKKWIQLTSGFSLWVFFSSRGDALETENSNVCLHSGVKANSISALVLELDSGVNIRIFYDSALLTVCTDQDLKKQKQKQKTAPVCL